MASFDGVSFEEAGADNGYELPAWEAEYEYVTQTIPGGAPVTFAIARKPRVATIPIIVTTAQYSALLGKVDSGESGTLVLDYGTATAVLQKLSSSSQITDDDDYWRAQLSFIRIG